MPSAFASLAQKVKAALGFGPGSDRYNVPTTRGAQYRTMAGGPMANLQDAIERRQPCAFFYDDKTSDGSGMRLGNPHAIWAATNGSKYLHMYVDPRSATASGSLPGWRTFLVDRIRDVSVYDLGTNLFGRAQEFNVAPGYNPGWYSRNGRPIVLVGR